MKKFLWIKPIVTSIIMLALVAGMGMVGARYSAMKSRAISEQTLPALTHIALGNQYRGQAFLHLVRAVNATSHEDFKSHESEIRKYSDLSQNEFDLYEDTIQSNENRALYQDVMKERGSYLVCRNEILILGESGKTSQAAMELTNQLLPMYEQYLGKSQRLVDLAVKEGIERTNDIRLIAIGSQIFAILASIAIFIFGFFLGFTR